MARSGRLNSRQKGAAGERELAHFISDHGFEARRSQQHKGTADSADIECAGFEDYLIECKRSKRVSDLYQWLLTAEEEAGEKLIPLVFHRRDREEWQLTMWAEDFLELRREIDEAIDTERQLRERIAHLEARLGSLTKGTEHGSTRETGQRPQEVNTGEDSA